MCSPLIISGLNNKKGRHKKMSKFKKFSDPDADPVGQEVTGLRIVKGLGVPPRSRVAGASKYDIASLEVGDAYVSDQAKDVRNVTVAARAFSKRAAKNGGVAPKFVTRKTDDGRYALIRES